MRTRSFRFRLAIFSALVSGVILIAFGVAAWVFVSKNLLDSVDSRLRVPTERMVRRVHEGRDWGRFSEAMRFFEREFEGETVVMIVSNKTGRRLFLSDFTSWMKKDGVGAPYLPTAEMLENAPPPPPRRERPQRREGPALPVIGNVNDAQEPRRGGPGGGDWQALGEVRYFTSNGEDGKRWRTASVSNSSVTVFIGMDLARFDAEVGRVRSYFLVALPFSLLAIAAGAWLISRRAMRPLDRIISTTSEMSAAELDRRIPVTGNESREFSKLVEVLNAMMDRLEGSFHQATRFTADASHELKTPIAIMQAEIESALKSCVPHSPEEGSLLNLLEENQRLKRITQSLLLLSQVDSGRLKLVVEKIDLSAELESLSEDAELLCANEGLDYSSTREAEIMVEADRVLLLQAVQNLLSNAIKYNQTGGRVHCSLAVENDEAVVEFFNTGDAIPPEDQEKIFDRFFRVDRARGVAVEGFGLGLNLSLEIVKAHGGTLELKESGPGGTRMELRLPKV